MATVQFPDVTAEIKKCREFLEKSTNHFNQLRDIANRQRKVLEICIDDVLMVMNDVEFVEHIKCNTTRYTKYFEEMVDILMPSANVGYEQDVFDILDHQRQLHFASAATDDSMSKLNFRRFEVQIIPSNSDLPRNLREVQASEIGHVLKLKGMVVRVTDVKPCITLSTYTCEVCGSEIFQSVSGTQYMPYDQCPSQRCKDNKSKGRLIMLNRGSVFVKYQELRLQELPDQVPVGNIPRSITVQCWGEQTRQCVPGDVITVSGIFLSVRMQGYRAMKSGLQTETYLKACKIEKEYQGKGFIDSNIQTKAHIKDIAQDSDAYSHLAASIAPEIFGHEDVKKALLLQLVGADTKVLADGMKIRGDINICLMGDPGVAKSQLLKYVAGISARGVYTTGKGSSGVGLTAAVVRDDMTGEMALEGGALVLADCGICCIDEFDKMDENDRTAIHEVMEQQTISIAKAGITTTLNARAAILAAANPLYGRYNKRKSISENVDLPNSLLSRFDLLFLLLDKADTEQDLALSRHVLHVHKHLKNSASAIKPYPRSAIIQYINLAKSIEPKVPRELTSYIVEQYTSLRSQAADSRAAGRGKYNDQTMMTARQLLSILRLSQALAKLRLSDRVSPEEVDEAIRLIHASKASILTTDTNVVEDANSSIFAAIKAMFESRQDIVLPFTTVENAILKKGFTSAQLKNCLEDYVQLGVLSIPSDGSAIELV